MPTLTLRPNAAGDYQQWTTFGSGFAHWDRTSDQNDATGVEVIGSTTLKETEHLADHGAVTGTINSVTAYVRHFTTGAGAKEYAVILWKLGAVEVQSVTFALSRGGFSEQSDIRTEKLGGGAWAWSDIDNLQVGIKCTTIGAAEKAQASEFWIVVDYTPVAGFRKLQYFSEPPTAGWNKLRFASEPPVPAAWNKLLYEGE